MVLPSSISLFLLLEKILIIMGILGIICSPRDCKIIFGPLMYILRKRKKVLGTDR